MLKGPLQKNKIIFIFATVLAISWLMADFAFASHVLPNILTDQENRNAWNDVISWIDFGNEEVEVTDSELRGYAFSDAIGNIALDCATTPSPPTPTCSGSAGDWGVANDGNGNLSGWAWNDNVGWISFSGSGGGFFGPFSYQVIIDVPGGNFSGWAWNDIVGWISFNCSNTGTCGAVDYKVKTFWSPSPPAPEYSALESSTFDTQIDGGVAFNTIMWQGALEPNTVVQFQIASSNSSTGPWLFLGDEGTTVSYYTPSGPGVQEPIRRSDHNNKRYFRYRVFLSAADGKSPRVDDVILNYSP